MRLTKTLWLAALAAAVPLATLADNVTMPEEYSKLIQQRSAIAMLGSSAFGDQVGLATGSFEIAQVDIDLPGNDALLVRVGRKFAPGNDNYYLGHFRDWDLDIPYMHGVFAKWAPTGGSGWSVDLSGPNRYKRCSRFAAPPDAAYQGGSYSAGEFWHGDSIHFPGGGDQEMLSRRDVAGGVPTDGRAYPIGTREGAVVRCLDALAATSQSGSQGEGFEVVTTDGTVYTFDHMVSRVVRGLKKSDPSPIGLAPAQSRQAPGIALPPKQSVAVGYVLPREEVLVFPSRVRDRFGNTVTYTWSPTNPWRLLRISASDGRQLDFGYSPTDPASYEIASITDGTRTWTYSYAATVGGLLEMTQPDGGKWKFGLSALVVGAAHPMGTSCDGVATPGSGSYTGTIAAPSGALVAYTLAPVLFGRSWVTRQCMATPGGMDEFAVEPYLFASLAIASKKISGPGLPAAGLSWTYAYGAPNQCWAYSAGAGTGGVPCTANSPVTRSTVVTDPDGGRVRYTFGNRYEIDEGLLLKEEHGWNGTSALRTVAFEYADPEAPPYAALNGASIRNQGDYDITSLKRPQRKVTTIQQGRFFIWEVATGCGGLPYCFDADARPTQVVKSSGAVQ